TMPTTTINSSDVENRFWWFDWVPITVNDTTQFSNKSKYTLDCYAALCKMYINIIKNLRPSDGIRFGMYWDDGESSFDSVWRYQNQNHVWCTYLKAKQAYIGFDDFILHPYFTGIHHNSDALSLTGDAFFNTTLINIKTYLQQNIGKDALALPFLSNELPTNSKIWLTEWDILASGASNFNNKIFNTFLDAYYYSEFLFGLIEMNTIGTRKNLYSISNKYLFNNLFSSAVSGSSHFQIAYNASHSTQLTNTSATFKKRILYHTQKILLPIINNTKGYKFVNVPNGGFTNVPTGVKIRVFKKDALGTPAIGENAGELIIYYYNTSGSSQTLNLNTYLSSISQNVISGYSLRYNPTSNKYKFTLWSDKMSASRGKTVLNTSETLSNNASVTIQFRDGYLSGSSGETELLINSSDLDASSNFKINKYEIGYIRVPLIYGASAMRKAKETEENFNLLKGNNFSIYPNPAKDNITLEYAGEINKNAILEIFDMKGELQYQKNIEIQDGINKYNIITNNLSKGTYIIKLKNNTEIKTEKIIIE
ncbi:MAG TPA: T9SS type A sorting domain-containing protein, partial [Chitinophagales bacterium]|nr:T9SS type A sorting domain-containing protein [Chitinophagales bacterium]